MVYVPGTYWHVALYHSGTRLRPVLNCESVIISRLSLRVCTV